jgi:hypothetical protein
MVWLKPKQVWLYDRYAASFIIIFPKVTLHKVEHVAAQSTPRDVTQTIRAREAVDQSVR